MTAFDLTPPSDAQRRDLSDGLSADERRVLLQHGTEAPFCGAFLDNKLDGIYTCRLCGLPLFRSSAKFDSGTGYRAFLAVRRRARSRNPRYESWHAANRISPRCGSHLGHVFPDGRRRPASVTA
jgi:peptide-methionine (R)-S-oxide reductase